MREEIEKERSLGRDGTGGDVDGKGAKTGGIPGDQKEERQGQLAEPEEGWSSLLDLETGGAGFNSTM